MPEEQHIRQIEINEIQSVSGMVEATIFNDEKEVAHCIIFLEERDKRLIQAAPELFAACEAVLKAAHEKKCFINDTENSMKSTSDIVALANLFKGVSLYTDPMPAALEQMLAVCMKVRGESCQEDNQ
ncbi:MAG: hypothetical protein H7829_03450 [Magnetococcus sp. THC-1_WYH]